MDNFGDSVAKSPNGAPWTCGEFAIRKKDGTFWGGGPKWYLIDSGADVSAMNVANIRAGYEFFPELLSNDVVAAGLTGVGGSAAALASRSIRMRFQAGSNVINCDLPVMLMELPVSAVIGRDQLANYGLVMNNWDPAGNYFGGLRPRNLP